MLPFLVPALVCSVAAFASYDLGHTNDSLVAARQSTCTSSTCPQGFFCVLPEGGGTACCDEPTTCLAKSGVCSTGLSLCPGAPDFCCKPGYECTRLLDGHIDCHPSTTSASSVSSMTTISASPSSSSRTSRTTSPTPSATITTPAMPPMGGNVTIGSDNPTLKYNGVWKALPAPFIPECAAGKPVQTTVERNATISFNTTGTSVIIRCITNEQGGRYSVIIGNQTKTFNSSSGTNPPSCGTGTFVSASKSLVARTFLLAENAVQTVTIVNDDGNFSFVEAIVLNDVQGPIVSSARPSFEWCSMLPSFVAAFLGMWAVYQQDIFYH